MPRNRMSPYRYDRAAVRVVLERDGYDAARKLWPREVVDPLARLLCLQPAYNSRRSLTAEQVAQLGTKPDSVLAAEWNVSHSTVNKARRTMGIPSTGWGREWNREQAHRQLRTLTDADLGRPLHALSRRIRVPANMLAAERRRRGLRVRHQGIGRVPDVTVRRLVAIQALRAAFPVITLEELAEVFRCTPERIRQLEAMASVHVPTVANTDAPRHLNTSVGVS